MRNFTDTAHGAARLVYHDGDFEVLQPGGFVSCAVTGARIPLQDLRYWSVDRQEPYVDAAAANRARDEAASKGEGF